jgi:DtxR family Mn-dependent transcriptional regulator
MKQPLSSTEENYLKAIFKICERSDKPASTNDVAILLNTKAASVTDMLKRLSEKSLINYIKYKGVTLTESGESIATSLIRKHRLWEVFLTDKLNFGWEEVHEIAEQLEHIKSEELTIRLEEFLDHPKFDPHGDPIPDREGKFQYRQQILLADVEKNIPLVIVGVNEHGTEFLQYLEKLNLILGSKLTVMDTFTYDNSLLVQVNNSVKQTISAKVAKNIFVQKT